MKVPADWEFRTEIQLLEPPAKGLAAPLAGKADTAPPPRANISVTRGVSGITDPAEALQAFLADLAKRSPGLKRLDEGQATFEDGAPGVYATVAFDAAPGRRAAASVPSDRRAVQSAQAIPTPNCTTR